MPLLHSTTSSARQRWAIADSDGPFKLSNTNNDTSFNVLEKYIAAYDDIFDQRAPQKLNTDEDSPFFDESISRLQEHLTGDSEGLACLVCLEDIKPTDPIWHCEDDSATGCFVILHMACAAAWAGQTKNRHGTGKTTWTCPKCRQEHSKLPSIYTCFCSKAVEPPFNEWNYPHSCGDVCGRITSNNCEHECLVLCHPGPHPPCPRIIQDVPCYCGKTKAARRCSRREFSCQKQCGKQLLHCNHACPALCHSQECPPCIRILPEVSCRCGSLLLTESMQCWKAKDVRCNRVCGKLLDCGKHRCSTVCCDGKSCGPCPLATTVRTCPCGKTSSLEVGGGVECGSLVPVCGQTCDKLLPCGIHHCSERCHTGPCPVTCREIVERTCQCGRTTKAVQCQDGTFRCERRCTAMRSCGKHQCKRRCCDGVSCPPCPEACSKWLNCKNHRCPSTCHSGACPPCPLTKRVSCACGKTSYNIPCGREATAPPLCRHPCLLSGYCRHQSKHPCHYGPCPPCPHQCGAPLTESCGHKCIAPCHDYSALHDVHGSIDEYTPPPAPVALGERDVAKRRLEQLQAPPAAVVALEKYKTLLESLLQKSQSDNNHPPCSVFMSVACYGNHVVEDRPCWDKNRQFSCDSRPCGRLLDCSNHTCEMKCHDVVSQPCIPCVKPCTVLRPVECTHSCPKKTCHPGECGPCTVKVTVPCHCGKTSLHFECSVESRDRQRSCFKVCGKPLLTCPHVCQAPCHPGPCLGGGDSVDDSDSGGNNRCTVETTVRCRCKRIKKKMPCCDVLALLIYTKSIPLTQRGYDSTTSLRILPCDNECLSLKAEEKQEIRQNDDLSPAMMTPGLRHTTGHQRSTLLKKERLHEAERRRMEQENKKLSKKRQKQRQALIRVIFLVSLVIFVTAGAVMVQRLLKTVDTAAQEAWGVSK